MMNRERSRRVSTFAVVSIMVTLVHLLETVSEVQEVCVPVIKSEICRSEIYSDRYSIGDVKVRESSFVYTLETADTL